MQRLLGLIRSLYRGKYIVICALIIIVCKLYLVDGIQIAGNNRCLQIFNQNLEKYKIKSRIYGDISLVILPIPKIVMRDVQLRFFDGSFANIDRFVSHLSFFDLIGTGNDKANDVIRDVEIDNARFVYFSDSLYKNIEHLKKILEYHFDLSKENGESKKGYKIPEMNVYVRSADFVSSPSQGDTAYDRNILRASQGASDANNIRSNISDIKFSISSSEGFSVKFKKESNESMILADIKGNKSGEFNIGATAQFMNSTINCNLNMRYLDLFEDISGDINIYYAANESAQAQTQEVIKVSYKKDKKVVILENEENFSSELKLNAAINILSDPYDQLGDIKLSLHIPGIYIKSSNYDMNDLREYIAKYFDVIPYKKIKNGNIRIENLILNELSMTNVLLNVDWDKEYNMLRSRGASVDVNGGKLMMNFDIRYNDLDMPVLGGSFRYSNDANSGFYKSMKIGGVLSDDQMSSIGYVDGNITIMPFRFDIKNASFNISNSSNDRKSGIILDNFYISRYKNGPYRIYNYSIYNLALSEDNATISWVKNILSKMENAEGDKSCTRYIDEFDGFNSIRNRKDIMDVNLYIRNILYKDISVDSDISMTYKNNEIIGNFLEAYSTIGDFAAKWGVIIDNKLRPRGKLHLVANNVRLDKINKNLTKIGYSKQNGKERINLYSSACYDLDFVIKGKNITLKDDEHLDKTRRGDAGENMDSSGNLDSDLNLNIIKNIDINGGINFGNIEVKSMKFDIFGGNLEGKIMIQVSDVVPSFYTNFSIRDAYIKPLMSNALSIDNIDGHISLNAKLATRGRDYESMIGGISGAAKFKADRIVVHGANIQNIAYALSTNIHHQEQRNIISKNLTSGETIFNIAEGSISFAKGVGKVTDFIFQDYRINGAALANFVLGSNEMNFASRFAWIAGKGNQELQIELRATRGIDNISKKANNETMFQKRARNKYFMINWNLDLIHAHINKQELVAAQANRGEYNQLLHEELNSNK